MDGQKNTENKVVKIQQFATGIRYDEVRNLSKGFSGEYEGTEPPKDIDAAIHQRAPLKTLNVSFPPKRDTEGGRSQFIKNNTMDPRFRGGDTVNRGARL